jgi:hypothetical protein
MVKDGSNLCTLSASLSVSLGVSVCLSQAELPPKPCDSVSVLTRCVSQAVLPRKSFIDAATFPDPPQLAQYLLQLIQEPTLYAQVFFFNW